MTVAIWCKEDPKKGTFIASHQMFLKVVGDHIVHKEWSEWIDYLSEF